MAIDDNTAVSESGLSKPVDSSRKIPPKYPERNRPTSSGGGGPTPPVASGSGEGGFFSIYKKGQGYWTRMSTAIAAALLGTLTAWFLYDQFSAHLLFGAESGKNRTAGLIIGAIFLVVYGIFVFWLTNKPRHVDFLVATDSEMKKVNWTSQAELLGSTKVVIIFMFGIAAALFLIDELFHLLFWLMNVIKVPPFYIKG